MYHSNDLIYNLDILNSYCNSGYGNYSKTINIINIINVNIVISPYLYKCFKILTNYIYLI